MSNSTPTPGSRLTVEDSGSTTSGADLADEARTSAPDGSEAALRDDDLPSSPGATTSGLSSLVAEDDGSIGHVFDQTNGVVDRLDGDSDGTAESDELSAEERRDEDPAFEAFADTEPQRAEDTDDPRVTGN